MGRVHAPALPLWQCPPIARTNSMRTAMSCHIVSCYCCPASLLFPSVGHRPQDPFQRSHPKHHLPRWFVRFHRRCPIADQIRLHYPPFRYRTRICIRIPLLSPLMLMMPGRRRMTYLSREKGEAKEAKDIEIQERDAFRLAAPKLFTKCCCCAHALFTLVESTRPNFWTIQR